VRFRKNGSPTDGAYSFSVRDARFENIATPVHAPIEVADYENYAHVEVRQLKEGEDVLCEPPVGRRLKSKKYKERRLRLRHHLVSSLTIALPATA
jgi:hypothetical protein